MSAYNGAFIHRTLSNSPLIGNYIPVHESTFEGIQGGTVGEHYHLTIAQHNVVQKLETIGIKLYEPISIFSELVYSTDGQVLMSWTGEVQ